MHILGKVFVWMVVIAAIASMVLMSRLIEVRNSWTQPVETLVKENTELAETIAKRDSELNLLKGEYSRVMLGWEKYWTSRQDAPVNGSVLEKSNGTMQVGVGQAVGIGKPAAPEMPVLYAFQVNPDNTASYHGAFQVTSGGLRPAQLAMKATFLPRDSDKARWPENDVPFRVRSLIPSAFPNRFGDLRKELTISDELLNAKKANLAIQGLLVDSAKEHLNFRLAELLGNPQKPGEVGLVTQLEEADEQRNAALAEVDRLRRQLQTAIAEMNRLVGENKLLVKSLPQPGAKPVKVSTK